MGVRRRGDAQHSSLVGALTAELFAEISLSVSKPTKRFHFLWLCNCTCKNLTERNNQKCTRKRLQPKKLKTTNNMNLGILNLKRMYLNICTFHMKLRVTNVNS